MKRSYYTSVGLSLSSSISMACLCVFLFLFISLPIVSASISLSDDIFINRVSIGRNILQAKKGCSVNFEFQNYTIITSKCKGPHYPADICCAAFKEFACPFATEISDDSTDCSSTMFSYINLNGKYPPGLFASECKEGKDGLACIAQPPPSQSTSAADHSIGISCLPSYSLLISTFLLLVAAAFQLF
ncbi:GPI-anchored protein LLG1-like [Impatiens glandulifera]|uniref:GPI-anchored protein LLG1-like n=1 Tax=Impatiens glandulifera TaxID=253017 RepID=UPI001FB11264|nr:GPI-anchored protein LLG1-like [Impatiens glandulifera]